jgi:hypothetical protein
MLRNFVCVGFRSYQGEGARAVMRGYLRTRFAALTTGMMECWFDFKKKVCYTDESRLHA